MGQNNEIGTVTKRGRHLATQLLQFYTKPARSKYEVSIMVTCSKIARLATTHNRLQEIACSVEMIDERQKRHDREDERIENAIRRHVATLPATKFGPLGVTFQGDPRGYTVKIHVPGDANKATGNTWGLGGDYGV